MSRLPTTDLPLIKVSILRIVHIEIRHFRGIAVMDWSPEPGINCLIGPGDSTKTTILDAIELCLNPRANFNGEDTDFYNHDYSVAVTVTLTLVDLPSEFYNDARYGLHLRGWNAATKTLVDESGQGLDDALSVQGHYRSGVTRGPLVDIQ